MRVALATIRARQHKYNIRLLRKPFCYDEHIMVKVIGVIGPIASGKDTAGNYIAEKLGITHRSISYPLKVICETEGIQPSRDKLIALGTKLAKQHGDDYLARYIVEHTEGDLVITGIRQLGQIGYLKHSTDFILISLDAKPKLRLERAKARGDKGRYLSTTKDFIEYEKKENSPPNSQRLFECMRLADFSIQNDSSIQDLNVKINFVLKRVGFNK